MLTPTLLQANTNNSMVATVHMYSSFPMLAPNSRLQMLRLPITTSPLSGMLPMARRYYNTFNYEITGLILSCNVSTGPLMKEPFTAPSTVEST